MVAETLEEYLRRNHLGEENAITSRELEKTFDTSGKELRNIINTLRRSGIPVASSGSGYYFAANAQEVRATIAHMTCRISGISAAIRGLN